MAYLTLIQWAHATLNLVIGCSEVSPGCLNCYARTSSAARGLGVKWGRGEHRHYCAKFTEQLFRWHRQPARYWKLKAGERVRIFPNSLSDWLDQEWRFAWLAELLEAIDACPHFDFLLLTKRPENWSVCLSVLIVENSVGPVAKRVAWNWLNGRPPSNVWAGTSIEDQPRANERLRLAARIPAAVRWLSIEPLLDDIDLEGAWNHEPGKTEQRLSNREFQWIVIGGESGHLHKPQCYPLRQRRGRDLRGVPPMFAVRAERKEKPTCQLRAARPCRVEAVRSIVRQAGDLTIPTFVKQLGTFALVDDETNLAAEGWAPHVQRDPFYWGSRIALRHSKGGDASEWPEDLRVLQFP